MIDCKGTSPEGQSFRHDFCVHKSVVGQNNETSSFSKTVGINHLVNICGSKTSMGTTRTGLSTFKSSPVKFIRGLKRSLAQQKCLAEGPHEFAFWWSHLVVPISSGPNSCRTSTRAAFLGTPTCPCGGWRPPDRHPQIQNTPPVLLLYPTPDSEAVIVSGQVGRCHGCS